MIENNPYQSPSDGLSADAPGANVPAKGATLSASLTAHTMMPRTIAAVLDNAIAMVLGVLAAKSIADDLQILQVLVLVVGYLGYYLLFEGLMGRTPGKLLTGLVVVQFNGARCTWGQSLVRTCFRVVEVNPLLLGALPAALSVLFSENHQRFGDKVAKTIVVRSRRIEKKR